MELSLWGDWDAQSPLFTGGSGVSGRPVTGGTEVFREPSYWRGRGGLG